MIRLVGRVIEVVDGYMCISMRIGVMSVPLVVVL